MVTEEESAPQFSDAYRQAESAFFQQFNEVDFYVEDEDQENFYFCILKKLLPEVRFENIFPHKGKARVIKHAVENQLPRKSIYVVDKDFDDVLGRQHQRVHDKKIGKCDYRLFFYRKVTMLLGI